MAIDRILVPVDFSEYSDAAVRAALALTKKRLGTTITLLHVVPARDTGVVAVEPMYPPPRMVETLYQERWAHAENELELMEGQVRAAAGPTTQVVAELDDGPIAERILAYAAKNCDLVIIGSHGLSGAARFLLGSVAEEVSRTAHCPVLVTPADALDADALPSMRRAVVGIDFSASSVAVARLAAYVVGIEAAKGATVELVHGWQPPFIAPVQRGLSGTPPELVTAIEQLRAVEAHRLSAFAGDINLLGVGVGSFLGEGTAPDVVIDRADEIDADLVVVGSHARDSMAEHLLGTVADRVLRHAGRPVLLLPAEARTAWS